MFPGMFSFTRRKRHTPLPNVPSLAKQHLRKYIPSMEHLEPVASGSVMHPRNDIASESGDLIIAMFFYVSFMEKVMAFLFNAVLHGWRIMETCELSHV